MTPQALLHHADTGTLWPPEDRGDIGDLPAAYARALAVRALRMARGERPRGYKIGFTNRTIWPRYNVFAPIWGTVWDSTLVDGGAAAATALSLARLCQPRIEPEAVFAFRATPPADAGADAIFDALDWVAPGFEIVQSHMPDWKFAAPHSVADGGLHGRLLLGRRTPVRDLARDAAALHARLAGARVTLHRDGAAVESGPGAHVLDSPLMALRHFLAELRACPGATDIAPGDVVTTGTWTDAWPVQAGQSWRAVFDSALPPLEVRFTD